MTQEFFRSIKDNVLEIAWNDFVFDKNKFHPGNREFIFGDPGKEPYRLYKYIADRSGAKIISEIGTLYGSSLMMWISNPNIMVYAFDLEMQLMEACKTRNMQFHQCDALCVFDSYRSKIMESDLIHFDTMHNGVHETAWYDKLLANGYKGVVIFDDIHLNPEMEAFWNSITQEKYDISNVGHWSGTGLVIL
jgi:hypothetical protein